MSVVITRGGRASRSDLATHDLHSGAKKTVLHRFHKIVRRDARNIIQEQLEAQVIFVQERDLRDIQEETLRGEEAFWGWFDSNEHVWEMDRLYDRQVEQLQDILDWEARHVYGLS